MKRFIITSSVLLLVGCNIHKATIKQLSSKSTSYQMSYDAMRRGTVVTIDKDGNVKKMLSEVQPDAAISQTTNITTSLLAKLKISDSISASQITNITESLSALGQRTAAVNILRDALYRLEEHCLNFPGECKNQYWDRFDNVVNQIVQLEKQNTKQLEEEVKKVKAEIQLKSMDKDLDARTNYQIAIKLLLEKDEKNSLAYFESLHKKYPDYFNIKEINNKLRACLNFIQ